ncbi:DUF3450 domain-containing protein [Marinospirillum minutulum]|uniref:DUF3450 domain-containing protein n=1 Tax=Marinospirillum minutulum TaxID=64974 RepID=UPI0003FD7FC1|nr:DUF3450 domain-containing protein [Marinospirillum minutulum]
MNNKLASLGGALTLVLFSGLLQAQPDASARQVEASSQQLAIKIQQQVEKLDAQRQADFQEWRQVRRELLLLEAYNQRQSQWNQRLQEQITSLEEQLASLDTTREALEPLLQQMAERLGEFIQHDLPFRQDERLFKVKSLSSLLARVDVSHAEKLRQLLTAYRNEVEQGRSLEVSREFLQLGDAKEKQRLTLLRVGRIGLYYLSEDEQKAGYWSAEKNTWLALNSSQRQQVVRGLALAEERGLPEFLTLPLSVPLRTTASTRLEAN